jgi:hypothetical protein
MLTANYANYAKISFHVQEEGSGTLINANGRESDKNHQEQMERKEKVSMKTARGPFILQKKLRHEFH